MYYGSISFGVSRLRIKKSINICLKENKESFDIFLSKIMTSRQKIGQIIIKYLFSINNLGTYLKKLY